MTLASLFAHGIGGVKDLPVPGWLFLYGAAVVLIVSFVALAILWKRPVLERAEQGRRLPDWLARVLLSRAVRIVLGAIGFALFLVVAYAALRGDSAPNRNLAPTFVFVIFWVGLVPVVAVLGNVWKSLNPWLAAADLGAWVRDRTLGRREPFVRYPERLGRWPATVLLFAFAAFELAYTDPSNPRAIAIAIVLYSALTWYGMIVFGRRAWVENGEAFSVYFGLIARVAPLAVREEEGERRIYARYPFTGLAERQTRPGTLAFVLVMLGTVAFDGVSRTAWWIDRRVSLESSWSDGSSTSSEVVGTFINVLGLLAVTVLAALAYLAATEAARVASRSDSPLVTAFLTSLVPIAIAYVVAHYFSLFVLQGQFAIPLASDPFGRGWDLFGTSDFIPDLAVLTPNLVWYVQVGALVAGHVAGLVLAHDRAISLFRSPIVATRTQYAMLVLMVFYTVGGLQLLASG